MFNKLCKNYAISFFKDSYTLDLLEEKYMQRKGLVKIGYNCPFKFIKGSTTKLLIGGFIVPCIHEVTHLKHIKQPNLIMIRLPFNIVIFKMKESVPIYHFGI